MKKLTEKQKFLIECTKVIKHATELLTIMIEKDKQFNKFDIGYEIERIEKQVYNLKYYNNN